MSTKILAALLAIALVTAYLAPMVLKMKDAALSAVVLLGIAVVVADVWFSLRKPEE